MNACFKVKCEDTATAWTSCLLRNTLSEAISTKCVCQVLPAMLVFSNYEIVDGFSTGPERSMTQQRRWRVVETVFVASVAAEKERRGHRRSWYNVYDVYLLFVS